MKPRFGTVLVVVSLGVLVLALAGCGGGGDEVAEPAVETTATTETETTATTETEATETEPTSTAGGFVASGKCKELAESAQEFQADFTSGDVDFQEAADRFQEFADEVPDEIQDDVQTLADAFSKYADALEGVDLTSTNPDPAALQKLQELSQEIDQEKVSQASQNVAAWVQKNCS
jgi:hypothetical protein